MPRCQVKHHPWLLGFWLKFWEYEGGGNFLSFYLILTFLSIIKYNPLIVETQTWGLRRADLLPPTLYKSGVGRASIRSPNPRCFDCPHYAVKLLSQWGVRTGSSKSPCNFFVVQFHTREPADSSQPVVLWMHFISDTGATSFPTNDKKPCRFTVLPVVVCPG